MKYSTRTFYTAKQRAMMWDCYQRGESLHSIAKLFDRGHSTIQGMLAKTGGIRPTNRKRSALGLSLSEREEISRGLASGESMRAIALGLERSPSTISREISRKWRCP